ncbi:MAG: hypothetical protein EPO35_07625 [Acidobacteria bacterium]|nr:MAG: hypothetical protein EPO35_07625 [Acidobacteriota bacterium]
MLLSYPVYRALRVIVPAAICVAGLAAPASPQSAELKWDSPVAALERWTAAIDAHTFGERDASVTRVAGLTPIERGRLISIAAPFAIYLRRLPELAGPPGSRLSPRELEAVRSLAKGILERGTFAAWLHRAVMFETDVAVLAPELTAAAMSDARDPGLSQAIRAGDGELGAKTLLNWHWRLARDLVDARDPLVSDAFAADWYHAVSLYQLRNLDLAEMGPHTARGFQLFPTDPRTVFDQACLADAMASARVQAVLISAQQPNFRTNVPSLESAETRASKLFAAVLSVDSGLVEARVRLARVVEKQGRAAEALALLAPAFSQRLPRELAYMAHLVAGRASAALGQRDEGEKHLNQALSLYPTAQAPVVSLSLLALDAGDLERAVGLAASLREHSTRGDRDDPWWWYFESPWLEPEAALERLRELVRR